jgi:uncharacterized protein YnzC (UPF0291/DUF896 family)
MTAKTPNSTRLTREERQALQHLREYLAQFKQSNPPEPQPSNRQDACV